MFVNPIQGSEIISRNAFEIERVPLNSSVQAQDQDQRALGIYLTTIQSLVNFCYRRSWITTGEVVGAFLGEPWQTVKSGFFYPFGWKENFNFYHLNPQRLTADQARQTPIILLHGNNDNQSAWISFAKKVNQVAMGQLGPLYTVNLPSGNITQKDFRIINQKLSEIKAQYQSQGVNLNFVDIVGHSRGGELISDILQANLNNSYHFDLNIRKAVIMGAVLRPDITETARRNLSGFGQRIYEINGRYDIIEVSLSSSLPANQRLELDIGHLELTFSDEAQQQAIAWLRG